MSTKFTKKTALPAFEMVDSHSLALIQAVSDFQSRITLWLLQRLKANNFDLLTASQLGFLSKLDCGVNHASNLARELGISRQAVHKTVRELERAGWLETKPDNNLGNQKTIVFTTKGEHLMAAARKEFSNLDKTLLTEFGEETLEQVAGFLNFRPE